MRCSIRDRRRGSPLCPVWHATCVCFHARAAWHCCPTDRNAGHAGHVNYQNTSRGYTMKKNMQGFTLIELMIVVAIIAILAAIAISQYQDYVIRSQVSEGSSLADGTKTALAEFYNNKGRFPPNNASAGLASPASITGNYVGRVDVGTVLPEPIGTIEAQFDDGTGASGCATCEANTKINDLILVFSAVTHEGSIEWNCRSTGLKQKWCGSSCVCTG